MQHIDQNFSAKNFGIIYNFLNRKGKIDIGKMSNEYGSVVADIKRCRGEIRSLTQKKRQSWDEEDKKFYSDKKQDLPYELPFTFSNRGFYRFLVKNQISIENNIYLLL